MLFDEALDHAVQISIAGAEAACEPVPATLGNFHAVSEHVELPSLAGSANRFDVQALLDAGRETRDLRLVVLSRGAVNDFDFHSGSVLFAAVRELTADYVRLIAWL